MTTTGCHTPTQASGQPIILFGMMLARKPKLLQNRIGKMRIYNSTQGKKKSQQPQNQPGSNIWLESEHVTTVWVELAERKDSDNLHMNPALRLGHKSWKQILQWRLQERQTHCVHSVRTCSKKPHF